MAEKLCPLPSEGTRAPCIEHRCRWYIQLLGKHPQKDAPLQEWGCAVEWLPILLIENAQQTRHFGAAVESSRNEARIDAAGVAASVVQVADELRALALAAASAQPQGRLLEVREEKPRGLMRRLLLGGGKDK